MRDLPTFGLGRFANRGPVAVALVLCAMAQGAAPFDPQSGGRGIFSLRLESDKPRYTVGERIALRLTIINETDRPYAAEYAPPSGLVDLHILDGRKQLVRPTVTRYTASNGAPYELPAHARVVAVTNYPRITMMYLRGHKGFAPQWEDIYEYGYQLTQPGTYTIVAIARIHGFERTPNGRASFMTPTTDRSNSVVIRLVSSSEP